MIDTHAHLQDERLIVDINEVIKQAKANGVHTIICASASLQGSKKAVELAKNYENVYATVGVHPEDATKVSGDYLQEIKRLAQNNKVVAIGEIGLDYHYDITTKDAQKKLFKEQIGLANELNLPIVVHSRDASQDTMEILKENIHLLKNGVCIHCFSMSTEILKECLSLGFHISLGGVVTFKNAKVAVDVVKECPLDRLMLETDCPYLAPEPFRGQKNEPKFIPYILQKIASIKNIFEEQVNMATDQTAKKFFRIK